MPLPSSPSPFKAEPLPALSPDHVCARCPVRQHTFCRLLGPGALACFKSLGTTGRLGAGQALCHEGDPANLVYNLTAGMLKLYRLLPDGRRHVTGFLMSGDFLGLAVDDEHPFSAEAVEPVEFCRFPRSRFESFIAAHPELERGLYRIAARELAAAQDQMVLLGRKTAAERVASFLLAMAGQDAQARLPMSRADIADYLGLTKETVSRTFSALKAAAFIRIASPTRLEILRRDRLEQLASGFSV